MLDKQGQYLSLLPFLWPRIPTAEKTDSKSVKCGFKSLRGYHFPSLDSSTKGIGMVYDNVSVCSSDTMGHVRVAENRSGDSRKPEKIAGKKPD